MKKKAKSLESEESKKYDDFYLNCKEKEDDLENNNSSNNKSDIFEDYSSTYNKFEKAKWTTCMCVNISYMFYGC